MRKRSEIAATKPSAAARTIPIDHPEIKVAEGGALSVRCKACDEDSLIASVTRRDDGSAECPACGAPLEGFDLVVAGTAPPVSKLAEPETKAETKSSTRVDDPPKTDAIRPAPPVTAVKDPERKYCAECASEWPIVPGKGFFINCGHTRAERVDHPSKAKQNKPPASLQGRTENVPLPPTQGPGPGPVIAQGNRLSIPWGEARMPVDQWNNFKCGGFILTRELPPGADAVEVGRAMLADLQKIADEAFEKQRSWYLSKLGLLTK